MSSPDIGHTACVVPWLSPSHCQCIAVGRCELISHCLSEHVISIIGHYSSISCPGDSRSRTTNGNTGQGEHCWVSKGSGLETELEWASDYHYTCKSKKEFTTNNKVGNIFTHVVHVYHVVHVICERASLHLPAFCLPSACHLPAV